MTWSADYWENRYKSGGNSGAGSYGQLCEFKADVINTFVAKNNIMTVMEFGCGDGNQLSYSNYPEYVGYDVSETAIDICKKKFVKDNFGLGEPDRIEYGGTSTVDGEPTESAWVAFELYYGDDYVVVHWLISTDDVNSIMGENLINVD